MAGLYDNYYVSQGEGMAGLYAAPDMIIIMCHKGRVWQGYMIIIMCHKGRVWQGYMIIIMCHKGRVWQGYMQLLKIFEIYMQNGAILDHHFHFEDISNHLYFEI